jgi:hypothetical protein
MSDKFADYDIRVKLFFMKQLHASTCKYHLKQLIKQTCEKGTDKAKETHQFTAQIPKRTVYNE